MRANSHVRTGRRTPRAELVPRVLRGRDRWAWCRPAACVVRACARFYRIGPDHAVVRGLSINRDAPAVVKPSVLSPWRAVARRECGSANRMSAPRRRCVPAASVAWFPIHYTGLDTSIHRLDFANIGLFQIQQFLLIGLGAA